MRIGLFSDVHLTRKPYRLVKALQLLRGVDLLLVPGDLADRGTPEQFALAESILNTHFPDKPIFTVSGNHDIPQNDPVPYCAFVEALRGRLGQYIVEDNPSGAYYVRLNEEIDLLGLNPLYHQKLFRFPDSVWRPNCHPEGDKKTAAL